MINEFCPQCGSTVLDTIEYANGETVRYCHKCDGRKIIGLLRADIHFWKREAAELRAVLEVLEDIILVFHCEGTFSAGQTQRILDISKKERAHREAENVVGKKG